MNILTRGIKESQEKYIFILCYKLCFLANPVKLHNRLIVSVGIKQTISVVQGKLLLKVLTCRHPQLAHVVVSDASVIRNALSPPSQFYLNQSH